MKGGPCFAVKLACGFYDNPRIGLSVNSGMVIVMSARTGKPVGLLADEGWLTSWRTAAAGCLAARVLMPERVTGIGMIGTGHQAALQLMWIRDMIDTDRVVVWNVDGHRNTAGAFVDGMREKGFDVTLADDIRDMTDTCNLIFTATPSRQPLLPADAVQPGTHIVALGADSPGKQELDSPLFGRARIIATDDHHQCVDHGDFGHAVRAGIVAENADIKLGDLLSGKAKGRQSDTDITIADLTGIPALDIAMAALFCEKLGLEI